MELYHKCKKIQIDKINILYPFLWICHFVYEKYTSFSKIIQIIYRIELVC